MAANATGSAAAAAKGKIALAKVIRQRNNENMAKFFAAGMVGMIMLFMLFHWTRFVFKRYEPKIDQNIPFLGGLVRISRTARSFLLRKVPGFTSGGHALVYLGYFATCVAIAFVKIDWTTLIGWAKRLGWVAVSNLALVTFLSLKNTPLAFLTTYSHERLNILHQVAGYSTVFWAMLHAIVYITAWSQSNNLHELLETTQVVGITAGFAFIIILGSALFLRKLRYEVFYITHIVMFMLILVLVGMHRPDFSKKSIIVVIFTASIWVADRALRFAKIFLCSFGNTVTITALPHGGTRVVLRKSPGREVPGTHCFIWIPSIRAAETHPFTIVSANPLELVIASYDGFTRDLHAYALNNQGKALKASLDGPYGVVPDFTSFTKVLFIAGGSGASFTLGVAADLVRKLRNTSNIAIEIVWVIREQEMIEWFDKEIQELRSSPLITLNIYCTRNSSPSSLIAQTSRSASTSSPLPDIEKAPLPNSSNSSPAKSQNSAECDMEKQPEQNGQSVHHTLSIHAGRPDVASMIISSVQTANNRDRIAVAACGPDSLMATTRKTVAACITPDGPSLELHCEQFGF